MKQACFAGGCFWCITSFFRLMDGVERVTAGYSGGAEAHPTYAQVKAQNTGHRESVLIDYDPDRVRFEELLALFLENVDPFDGAGQFIDRGRSYTLAVYYLDPAQRDAAAAMLRSLGDREGREPQIALEAFSGFWPAEEEHQDYDLKHPAEFERELMDSGRKARRAGHRKTEDFS